MVETFVVVGIDGGYASGAALEIAMHEASLRGTGVRAIVCWPPDCRRDDGEAELMCSPAQAAELLRIIEQSVRRDRWASTPVVRQVLNVPAAAALVEASIAADLLVLGSSLGAPSAETHGRRVLTQCLAHARSPIVVVPWTFDALGGT